MLVIFIFIKLTLQQCVEFKYTDVYNYQGVQCVNECKDIDENLTEVEGSNECVDTRIVIQTDLAVSYSNGTYEFPFQATEQALRHINSKKLPEVTIQCDSDQQIVIDGEMMKAESVSFNVVPKGLSIVAPPASVR